jgi:hypothetical protein
MLASFDSLTGESYTPSNVSDNLKTLVIRATSSTHGEGDPAAALEIQELLAVRPELMTDAVYLIRCRIKVLYVDVFCTLLSWWRIAHCFLLILSWQTKDCQVQVISMELLDQSMVAQGL